MNSEVNQRDELIFPVCKYALVIGVSDYKNSKPERNDISHALNDKQMICELLQRLDYDEVSTNDPAGHLEWSFVEA
jgi:hypothetical protein